MAKIVSQSRSSRDGPTGEGGAKLSAYGRRLLTEFGNIERVVGAFTKKLNAELNF